MLKFALKHMATRRAKLIMTALSVVITASVALLAYNISTQVSEGIVNTAAKYDIINSLFAGGGIAEQRACKRRDSLLHG